MSLGIEPVASTLEAAKKYIDLGWAVVPVRLRSKAVEIPGWTERSFGVADLEEYARRAGGLNVGVKLGEPSGGLIDIDIDAPEALIPARAWLPEGAWVFGRPGKPGSHYLYYSTIPRRVDFRDRTLAGSEDPEARKRAMLLEIRSTGHQTVFPPSVHESGEPIRWEAQPVARPATYEPDVLIGLAKRVAAAALLARYWPKEGSRHDAALALGGVLARAGWDEEAAEDFVLVVAQTAGDDEANDRARAARDSVIKHRSGEAVTGFPRLLEYGFDQTMLRQALEWLGINEEPRSPAVARAVREDELVRQALDALEDIEERTALDPYVALGNPNITQALAILYIFAPADYHRMRDRIKNAGDRAINLRELDRIVKARAATIRAAERSARQQVKEALPDAPIDTPLVVPEGFEFETEGIVYVREKEVGEVRNRIAHRPIIITGRYRDAEEDVEFARVAWRDIDGWRSMIIERAQMLDRNKIVALAGRGFPVDSGSAADIVRFLSAFEAENAGALPKRTVMSRLGWTEGKGAFVLGAELITENSTIEASEEADEKRPAPVLFRPITGGDAQIAAGYRAAGTIEGWLEAIRPLADYPKPRLALYASAATPLLEIIGVQNFVIDFAGRTSTGKTTTLRIAASMWGNPDERAPASAIGTWDATKVWIERASSILSSIPLILDDTKRAKDAETVAEVLYGVVSGRGRARGNTRSTSRVRTWQTVLISSGERQAVEFTAAGGTRARTIEVVGAPFGSDRIGPVVEAIDRGVREHYGHAGRIMIRWLLKNRRLWPQLKEQYLATVEEYAGSAHGVARRLAKAAAAITMGAVVLHAALKDAGTPLPWDYADPFDGVWAIIEDASKHAAPEQRALEEIVSYAHAHEQQFIGRHREAGGEPMMPAGGWIGYWPSGNWDYIAFFPSELERILQSRGFDPDAVIHGWYERGWLITDRDRKRKTKFIRVGEKGVRMYAISRAIFEPKESE